MFLLILLVTDLVLTAIAKRAEREYMPPLIANVNETSFNCVLCFIGNANGN